MERRKTKFKERLLACRCCSYPLSQRHHLLEVSDYEENEFTWQLCANCHEVYHIIDKAFKQGELWSQIPQSKVGKIWYSIRTDGTGLIDKKNIHYLMDLHELANRAKDHVANTYKMLYEQAFDRVIYDLRQQGWSFVCPVEGYVMKESDIAYFEDNYKQWMKATLEANGYTVIPSNSDDPNCPHCGRPYNDKH